MIEMLIVIAVIGIMAALVISAFSNVSQDTRRVVARQQQAEVQNAVNAWVNSYSQSNGLEAARTQYNGAGSGNNSSARLAMVKSYLDDSTYSHLASNTSAGDQDKVKSAAMKKTGQYIVLSDWAQNSYPKVELLETTP